jgi:hypothetical protein
MFDDLLDGFHMRKSKGNPCFAAGQVGDFPAFFIRVLPESGYGYDKPVFWYGWI